MNIFKTLAAGLIATVSLASAHAAEPAYQYRSVWFPGGDDVESIRRSADWYKAVFGMLEVQRFGTGQGRSLGIGLNFGTSLQDAKSKPGPVMGIAKSWPGVPGNVGNDPTARISFNVTRLQELVGRATEYGGKVDQAPRKQSGKNVAIVKDPIGNRIELIESAGDKSNGAPKVWWNTVRFPALDPEKNAGFYKRVLGMQEIARSGSKEKPEIRLNFGGTVAEANSSSEMPITISWAAERTKPLLTDFASQIAIGFSSYATLQSTLNRAYAEGTAFLSDPHYIAPTGTFARFLDPDGTFVELAGRCDPADVGTDQAVYLCGPAKK